MNVTSSQNADCLLCCSRGKLWTVGKQQEWEASILPTCCQLGGKDNCSSSDNKVVGKRDAYPCSLLGSDRKTLYGKRQEDNDVVLFCSVSSS